jgi:mannose-1-phosphate guanylyltransferase
LPKCLVPIRGRALLDYWLDLLFARGTIDSVLINTHHLADRVRRHVSGSPWSDRVEFAHERELVGTAGTIKANRDHFGNESFLVAHADNLTTFDLEAFLAGHSRRPARCAMSMLTFQTDDPASCGIVELDKDGVVTTFHEKKQIPPGNLANAAVYVLTPEVADTIARSDATIIDFSTEVIPKFVGRIFAIHTHGYHRDVGTPESLALANSDFGPFGRA